MVDFATETEWNRSQNWRLGASLVLSIMSEIAELASSIAKRQTILFVGAGVSMSVGLPSWQKLIDHLIDELGLKPELVGRPDMTYQTLAEYYRLKTGSIGPLRSWMDRNWAVSEDRVKGSAVHRLIVELDFPIIYTTNYDRNLEAACQDDHDPMTSKASFPIDVLHLTVDDGHQACLFFQLAQCRLH